jgi:Xaa-Pro aminopeptidase
VHHLFRQNSDLYYLTGFEEPEAVLILAPTCEEGEYLLFNRVRDREHEIWDGPRAGQAGARKQFLADQAFPIQELSNLLPTLLANRSTIYYSLGINKSFDAVLLEALNVVRSKMRSGVQAPSQFADILPSLHEMRLHKSEAEIAVMQKTADITKTAHIRAMQTCRPGQYEYELQAEIIYEFLRQGASTAAYPSIVGSGANSCVLHYIKNDKKIMDGDLVLIDAGAEYQNYAADITRTFPANGQFSAEQRAIYEIVLAAQTAAIESIKPGAPVDRTQTVVVKTITQGLLDLGILTGKLDDLIEQQAYLPFYMHRASHWLGLDVHDVGRYKIDNHWRSLAAGMVLTVEPGIYISAELSQVPKRWHNIGVRIEDDVLVTKTGYRVLSQYIPKTIDEIETIMRQR